MSGSSTVLDHKSRRTVTLPFIDARSVVALSNVVLVGDIIKSCRCVHGDGDCDESKHCVGDLKCGDNNCAKYKHKWLYTHKL